MRFIDKLTEQVENLLYKLKSLESENIRLKQQLSKREMMEENIVKLELIIERKEEEAKAQEKELEGLIKRLEKLL